MSILGLSFGFHDAAATVLNDAGHIIFAGHAERYSKQKHDKHLNLDIMHQVLDLRGPITDVAYYENPRQKMLRMAYSGQWNELKTQHLSTKTTIRKELGYWPFGKDTKVHDSPHHLAHAAAGFQTSPFNEATVVIIDAVGEWDTASIWHAYYEPNGIANYSKLWSMRYPNSMGLLYSAATDFVGLKAMDEEYILMGMAAYGRPRYFNQMLRKFVDPKNPLHFKQNLHIGINPADFNLQNEQDKFDFAASAQAVLELQLRKVLQKSLELRPPGALSNHAPKLVFGGGVALNCLANRILPQFYQNVWIMPNPGDAGSSLGAAALAYQRKVHWETPYLGFDIEGNYPVDKIIEQLLAGKIVGVANGKAEFGPRALGNRSLLADPRILDIKKEVNRIKRRQEFRPFSPAILEEYVHHYFVMPKMITTSPYMQYVAKCMRPHDFSSIVHKDCTSRVQTVGKEKGSGFRALLLEWHRKTKCPMLLNTSLNVRGEPMVNDEKDAERFAKAYNVPVFTST